MYKQVFISSSIAAVFSALISYIYVSFYCKEIIDFSEAASTVKIITTNLSVCMAGGLIYILARKVLSIKWADFVIGFLLSLYAISMIFIVLKSDDPTFSNPDTEMMKDFYKVFIIPLSFIPSLSWLTFKPLFVKS